MSYWGYQDIGLPMGQTGTSESAGVHMYNIYNPSRPELNSFCEWLWSANILDQLAKWFSRPMDSIISLSRTFLPIETSLDQSAVKFAGGLDCGVTMHKVISEYNESYVGEIKIPAINNFINNRKYQTVFQYSPFVEYKLYLPFVGLVDIPSSYLNAPLCNENNFTDNQSIGVQIYYYNNVVTGATMAFAVFGSKIESAEESELKNWNKPLDQINHGVSLMQFGCNTSITYPLSGSSADSVISSIINVATGAGLAIAGGATGNPEGVLQGAGQIGSGLASYARGASTGITTGGFNNFTGSLGVKRPYIVRITHNPTKTNDGGFDSTLNNKLAYGSLKMHCDISTTLKDINSDRTLHGWYKFQNSQIVFDGCTEEESAEICQIMDNQGIYIN